MQRSVILDSNQFVTVDKLKENFNIGVDYNGARYVLHVRTGELGEGRYGFDTVDRAVHGLKVSTPYRSIRAAVEEAILKFGYVYQFDSFNELINWAMYKSK